jgi:hypothetical protein
MSFLRGANIAFFAALLASALALGPALAHLFELPNKIGLPGDEYFIVQKAYRGWSLLGGLLLVQVAALATAAYLARTEPRTLKLVLLALVAVLAAQIVFWLFTYPANVATANWTLQPASWERLRWQWEYSHAAGAILQLSAFCLLIIAVLGRAPTTIPDGAR